MDNTIFHQREYEKINPKLADYGCFFLTLLFLSQQQTEPRIKILEKQDVLKIAKVFQEKGYVDQDFFVSQASLILSELTGKKFKQLTLKSNFGILGRETYFPVLYPVEKEVHEIVCYRHKDNMKLTHFSLGKTNTGENQEVKIIFNTLGNEWLNEKKGVWLASDKRLFREV